MLIKYIRSILPVVNFVLHTISAVLAKVFEISRMALARETNKLLCFFIKLSVAEVFKLESYTELLVKLAEIVVEFLRAYVPA